jgi:hypothetical protein
MTGTGTKAKGNDPVITVGMKVMFHYRGGWFVGDVLRFEGERVLIERQQKRMNLPREWVHEDDIRQLPKSTPKSAIAP